MGSAKKAPEPPDTSKYSDAAYAQGQQMNQWAQQMWETGQQEWGRLQQWSQDVMGSALPAMNQMYSWAADQQRIYENEIVPQMQSLFSEAEKYASKAEEGRQRGAAIQDVKNASEAQREAQTRKLESYGIDPSETRYAALDKQAGIAEAANAAFAANQAGERTKEIGRGLRQDAINVGAGLANQMLQANQIGSGMGVGALNAAGGASRAGSTAAQGAMPFAQGAYQGYDLGAGIVDTSYGRELQRTEVNNAAAQQNFNNMMAVGQSAGQMAAMVADGGPISAPGGPTDDAGAVAISDGEYVIPADVVRKLGTNHFDKMIEKETGRPPPSQKHAIPIDPSATPPQPMGLAPQAGILQ